MKDDEEFDVFIIDKETKEVISKTAMLVADIHTKQKESKPHKEFPIVIEISDTEENSNLLSQLSEVNDDTYRLEIDGNCYGMHFLQKIDGKVILTKTSEEK